MKINTNRPARSGLTKFDILVMVLLGLGGGLSLVAGALGGTPFLGMGVFAFLIMICAFYTNAAIERQRRIDDLPRIRASQRKRAEQVIRGLANHHRTTAGQTKSGLPSMSMISGGQAVEFSAAANNLMVSMALPSKAFRLYVYPHEQMRGKGFRNAVDAQLLDKEFDTRFLIQTNDQKRARQVLTPALRTEIHNLADLVQPAPLGVALNGSKLKCFVALPAHDDWRAADQCLAVMREFQILMGLWDDQTVMEVLPEVEHSKDVNCLVCGDPIHLQIVKCQQCRTPVHLECWTYIGSCSVFGCGSKRYDTIKG